MDSLIHTFQHSIILTRFYVFSLYWSIESSVPVFYMESFQHRVKKIISIQLASTYLYQ